jgi:two-component system, OmpR family, phosphate regulon response regulator PhoB
MNAKNCRILLIDDDPDMHLVVKMILEPEGYEITCCRTGSEGLEAMRRQPPDLVLLDIMLADPSEGLRVACEVRHDERIKRIPIIMISAIGEKIGQDYYSEVCPGTACGDMFLEKPFDPATVREAVSWILEQKAASP